MPSSSPSKQDHKSAPESPTESVDSTRGDDPVAQLNKALITLRYVNDFMSQELEAQGLQHEENYITWRELQYEDGVANDPIALSKIQPRFGLVLPMVEKLVLPANVKEGISSQRIDDRLKNAERNLREAEEAAPVETDELGVSTLVETKGLKYARLVHERLKLEREDTLVRPMTTGYRGYTRIATAAAASFKSLSHRQVKAVKGQAVVTKNRVSKDVTGDIPVDELISGFRKIGNVPLRYYLVGKERLISDFFAQDHSGDRVQFQWDQFQSPKNYPRILEASEALRVLSGAVTERREEVLSRFDGAYPIVLDAPRWTTGEAGWIVRGEGFGLRLPYGVTPLVQQQLLEIQWKAEQGFVEKCSIEIRGRVAPDFLKWMSGEYYEGVDPIPQIEIRYVFTLPSGKEYQTILKAAKSYSLKPEQPLGDYDAEDQKVIQGRRYHFILPQNKTARNIFTDFREEDYPSDLRPYLSSPIAITELNDYRILRKCWDQSFCKQLVESEAVYERSNPVRAWMAPEMEDEKNFGRLWDSEAEKMMTEDHLKPSFKPITREEIKFLRTDGMPFVKALCDKERLRIASNADEVLHQERLRDGWIRPREGYGMRMRTYIFDRVKNMRLRNDYREQKSIERSVSQSDVVVPDDVGVPYNVEDRIFGAQDIRRKLDEILESGRAPRVTELRYYDPSQGKNRLRSFSVDKYNELSRFLLIESNNRVSEAAGVYFEESQAHVDELDASSFAAHRILREIYTSVQEEIRTYEEQLQAERVRRKKDLGAISKELRKRFGKSNDFVEHLQEASAGFQAQTAVVDERYQDALKRAEYIHELFFPTYLFHLAPRKHSIIDRQTTSFIYGIPPEGPVRYAEVRPDAKYQNRITHGQLMEGGCAFGLGELMFAGHDRILHSLSLWEELDRMLNERDSVQMEPKKGNNATGHFEMDVDGLPSSEVRLRRDLEAQHFDISDLVFVDCFAPCLRISNTGMG